MPPTVEMLLGGYSVGCDLGSVGFCSVYLVHGTRRILYDCGHAGRRRALRNALAVRGLDPSDITEVVLSHGHWDHLQNADLFGRVLLHPAERRYLEAPNADDNATPPWSAALLASSDVRPAVEGDVLMPGVEVIELPGHTPGSIGLTVATDDGLVVLTGDAVSTPGVYRSGRCSNVMSDEHAARASIHRVRALADVVCPGHDRPFRPRTGYLTEPEPVELRVPDPRALRAEFHLVTAGSRSLMPWTR
jgi:N-acyl homoserine lactone hydrolase